MRIGIFGGSFDPPHVGHLLLAQDAIDALSLDELIVVPAGTQPLKPQHHSTAADRLAMVNACFHGVARASVDPVEIDRGGLSFMVDTVEHLRSRWPSATFHLLIGDDVLPTLPRWREPERLLSLVELVVLHRVVDAAGHSGERPVNPVRDDGYRQLATRRVDVSSTEIRRRVREGRSIRGFVPDAVAEYIASTALYLSETSKEASARA